MTEAPTFDHIALAGMEDPYSVVAEARGRCPVLHTDAHDGYYVVLRFADVWEAARDTATFSSANGASIPRAAPVPLIPIEFDPPQHTNYRKLLLSHLGLNRVSPLEPDLVKLVNEFLDEAIERGECDVVNDVLFPMATVTLSWLFGMDRTQAAALEENVGKIIKLGNLEAAGDLFAQFGAIIAERRQHPRGDIPSDLIAATIEGRPLEDMEIINACFTVFTAGLETVVSAAAYALELLWRNPDQRAWLVEDLNRVPQSIEELLRYISPFPGLARTTTRDVDVDGSVIPAGEKVLLLWMGANHDETQFPEPEKLKLDRAPTKHLAFGAGPHRCVGAHLARLELSVFLRLFLERAPDYDIPDPSAIRRVPGATRGMGSMPIRFRPAGS
ncbi:cytochrome P450 [Sporichthya sp.]|uniref:cytochrome P450 n=1 Tax=Sporichthya sp. TaxID=65475 RepID=UPI00181525A0|nr:cytochrome P450 [Sporichthya sp.]MBA3741356.1 cytochrome P450 [Sporichthya sp.]